MVEICLKNHKNSQVWSKSDQLDKTKKFGFKKNCDSLVWSIINQSKCFNKNIFIKMRQKKNWYRIKFQKLRET